MTNTHSNESPARRATIDDVAAGAGVSVATVSRALRNLPNVAESTRQRVADVAASLAYQPDPAAARLAAGRTGTVTVAVPSLNGWYFSTVVAGAETVCADAGLEFQVIGIATPQQRDRLLDELQRIERRTDGLILIDITVTDEQAASLQRRRVSLATVGSRTIGHPSVAIDDTHVGRVAADHLVGLGHRRIAVIGGVADGPMSFDAPIARRRGFESAIHAHGITLAEGSFMNGQFNVAGGYAAMTALIDSAERPTAVFAMSDEMAFGAIMALNEHGLVPGDDVSLIGVDDHEFAQVVRLTTIRQPVADHGSAAARLLIETMTARDRSDAGVHRIDAEVASLQPEVHLVERSTTGPPPRT
ncbi:MAG: LacI family DNA-binding transcriptional regulator [Ilumatobacter sp.]|uniref:LacI family DNA-binding transcriptional regulator n=2 Tax=Ilumatobacter sp. TaxID=1967498 RepID=UPI0032986424